MLCEQGCALHSCWALLWGHASHNQGHTGFLFPSKKGNISGLNFAGNTMRMNSHRQDSVGMKRSSVKTREQKQRHLEGTMRLIVWCSRCYSCDDYERHGAIEQPAWWRMRRVACLQKNHINLKSKGLISSTSTMLHYTTTAPCTGCLPPFCRAPPHFCHTHKSRHLHSLRNYFELF